MIVDKPEHQKHLWDVLVSVNIPGAVSELHSEVKAAVRNATVAEPAPPSQSEPSGG